MIKIKKPFDALVQHVVVAYVVDHPVFQSAVFLSDCELLQPRRTQNQNLKNILVWRKAGDVILRLLIPDLMELSRS